MTTYPLGARRAARSLAALAALVMFVTGLVTLSPGARASAAATPACLAGHVNATSSLSSRPGGTTAQLVFSSTASPSCLWSVNATGYQWLSASGVAIGPVIYQLPRTLSARWTPLYFGFQAVARLSTMAGVQCTTKSATSVRVGAPGVTTPYVVALARAVAVCVGGTTAWSSVTTALPTTPRCRSAQLAMSLGGTNGAAGTTYHALIFRNASSSACVVTGIPTVHPLRSLAIGDYLGPRARPDSVAGFGYPVRLVPGAKASAAFGVATTGNWSAATCAPAHAVAVSVTVSGARGMIPLAFSTCTKLVSTSIRGVVAGVNGL